jgi:membrane protease YdiL (CAAX protease family)
VIFVFVLAGQRQHDKHDTLVGGLILLAWAGAIVSSFAIRAIVRRRWPLPADADSHERRRARWPQPTDRSRQWTARYAIVTYAATFAAVIGVDVILRYVLKVHIQVAIGVLIVDAILLTGLIPLARRRGLSPSDLGIKPTRPIASMGLVFLALIAYVGLAAIWIALFINDTSNGSARVISQASSLSTFEIVLTAFAVGICAPVVEEIFFRGLLYRSLRNSLPIWAAALIAGMLFGLVHITGYPLITLPIKAAFGVIACLLYERTGSLLPGMALHSFVDASAVDIALTGNDRIVLTVTGLAVTLLIIHSVATRIDPRPRAVATPAEQGDGAPVS